MSGPNVIEESANREDWLQGAVWKLRDVFNEAGYPAVGCWNRVRVSCGWPGGGSPLKRIGECWAVQCSAAGVSEIFISPLLDEPVGVLDVLAHELVHAVVGVEHGHKGPFRKCATAIGLEGKMTSTKAGDKLRERLEKISDELGPYPHKKLSPSGNKKKQSTRLIKIQCPGCGWTARAAATWIDVGLPTCVCGAEFQEEE